MNYHPGNAITEYPGYASRKCYQSEQPGSPYLTLFTMPANDVGHSPVMVIDGLDMRYDTAESSELYGSYWIVADGDDPASSGTRITDRIRLDNNANTRIDFAMQTDSNGQYPMLEAGEALVFVFEDDINTSSSSSSGEGDGPYAQATPSALANLTLGAWQRYGLIG